MTSVLPWFLRDGARLEHERRCIDALSASSAWLIGYEWYLQREFAIEAVIRAHGHDYTLRLTFPSLFPNAPLVVRPMGESQRLSGHQYGGPDGPLCLQWGPDNWHPQVTAAEMLRSAHELLETENPAGHRPNEPRIVAPTRHQLTLGQEVRAALVRWYLSQGLARALLASANGSYGSFQYSLRDLQGSWASLIHSLQTSAGDEVWSDDAIPPDLPGARPSDRHDGVWVRTALDSLTLRSAQTFAELRSILRTASVSPWDGSNPELLDDNPSAVLLTDLTNGCHLFVVLSEGKLLECASVSSGSETGTQRAPVASLLREKTVAIVGLGSAGSKIALTLARMGVGGFYLVDHDLMLPENLRRHALDWEAVTQHKADAVARAIRFIDPSITVETSKIHLTGQESNAVINLVLQKIGECDLLIDATADSRVFNLLSAVSGAMSKPMAWMEVFAGGIGGLVARSRPGADPSPQEMRASFLHFCEVNPAPAEFTSTADYMMQSAVGEPISAGDAEVGVIAHHAARLVVDSFLPESESAFPYSFYLVGLTKAWVFEAPFETIPLAMGSLPRSPSAPLVDPSLSTATLEFLTELLKREGPE